MKYLIDIGAEKIDILVCESFANAPPPNPDFRRVQITSPADLDTLLANAALLQLYNRLKLGKPIKKLESHTAGVAAVWKLLEAGFPPDAAAEVTDESAPAREQNKPNKKLPRVSKYGADKKIKLLVEKNPKRPNTKAFAAFALYKVDMTVAEALAAGVPRGDISWDVRHKFIALE